MKTSKLVLILVAALIVMTVSTGFFVKSSVGIPDKVSFNEKVMIFTSILAHIQRFYIEQTDYNDLVDKAIEAMFKELDPHSAYLKPKNTERLNDNYRGYAGIGVSFIVNKDKIVIMDVFKGGPSSIAGLERGDRIVAINGENAIGIAQEDVPKKLKGPAGTTVSVSIERPGFDSPHEFTISRGKINPNSINGYYMLDSNIGYIRINSFTASTGREMENALIYLESKGMKRLILDLRGNTGGYLQAAKEVADKFLDEGQKIVFTKDGKGNILREWYATAHKHPDFPLIVMIDNVSASASEIVSGAIQDWDRGLILGRTSFGKGLVQTPFQFKDGSSILLTTARYYTPSGRLIQRDYKGKSVEEYYREGRIDSLKNKLHNKDLIFHTSSGRIVYGGGGINPDIVLKGNTPDTIATKIALDMRRNLFDFYFADSYIAKNLDTWKSIDDFKAKFRLTDEIIDEMVTFAKKNDYKFTLDQFVEAREDLYALMKYEIARQLWGWEGFYRVREDHDDQLKAARTYFEKAKEIMALSNN